MYYSQDEPDGICKSLTELLEKESESPVFMEGISYSLFKMAELGRFGAAEVLLRYGADVSFEGKCLSSHFFFYSTKKLSVYRRLLYCNSSHDMTH